MNYNDITSWSVPPSTVTISLTCTFLPLTSQQLFPETVQDFRIWKTFSDLKMSSFGNYKMTLSSSKINHVYCYSKITDLSVRIQDDDNDGDDVDGNDGSDGDNNDDDIAHVWVWCECFVWYLLFIAAPLGRQFHCQSLLKCQCSVKLGMLQKTISIFTRHQLNVSSPWLYQCRVDVPLSERASEWTSEWVSECEAPDTSGGI